ncbi:MAG: hypothetical protein ACM31C_05480, partial [Acidobacteriota bacterium]
MRMRLVLVGLFAVVACSSGSKPQPTVPPPEPHPAPIGPMLPVPLPPAPPKMTLAQSGIVPEWIDRTADPCTDFFAYACGGFVKTAVIPPDRSSWGAIQIVTKDNEEFLKKVLEDAAANPGNDPVAQKLGAYYAACIDEAAVERAGVTPIQPMLAEIAKVKDAKTAAAAVTYL